MDRKPLAPVGRPHSTPQFEEQSVIAALKRRLQMMPGNLPLTATDKDPVSHYQGADENAVLALVPMRLMDAGGSADGPEDLD